ncbi:hypothetical protein WR25_05350 [Diploscapter pachys]|uniref:PEP-utilising enzyme mobile domain-containing protein n=1 Tax=Diploscapter pachys TaxID=2018661 RepID=A0A2A2KA16_9BILA|nr:hypothetical protein WR25_05350 [Diploscapter pachys]
MKKDRLAEIVVAGEKILTDAMLQQGERRFGRLSKLFPLRRMGYMIRTVLYDSYRQIEEIRRIAHETEEMGRHNELSIEGLMALYEKQKRNLLQAISSHGLQSMFSSFTYIIVGMLIRGKEEGDMSAENLSDIAKVFSHNTTSQHVISADVPAALYKLAMSIRAEGLTEQFLSAADSLKALDVISRGSNSARLLEMFFKMHGHRGPKELYYDARTWAEDPDLLVHSLKTTLQNYRPDEGVEDVNASRNEDIIEQLNCKPTGIRRKLMMLMIDQTRRGVAFREEAKNHLVRTTHATRLTLRRLGQAMFEKGILPDSSLWIHFTPEELNEVARTRDAKLIARAYRRKQFAPNFCNQRYHHVYHGPVIPIDENVQKSYSSIVTLHGTTVCEGCIRGKARVAKNLEEARQTQPGEILITRHTDICWSPFFPIIKGIVTEIGGLLSHGAVVAREYGLPSLIAVANATDVFSTGDSVELNANLGTISKIAEQQ